MCELERHKTTDHNSAGAEMLLDITDNVNVLLFLFIFNNVKLQMTHFFIVYSDIIRDGIGLLLHLSNTETFIIEHLSDVN